VADLPIGVDFDLAAYERAFDQIARIAGEKAEDAVKAAEAEFKKLKPKLDKATGDAGKSMEKFGGIAEKAGAKIGGVFGEAADLVFDFIAPLGEATAGMGALGAGITAGAAGVVALAGGTALAVAGIKALADGAVEAADRLYEAGQLTRIPAESQASLDDYVASSANLAVELDVLRVNLGAAFADDLSVLAEQFRQIVGWVNDTVDGMQDLSRSVLYFVSLGLSEYLFEARDAQYELAAATRDSATAAREWAENERAALIALGILVDDTGPASVKTTKEKTKAVKEEDKALTDMLNTLRRVQQADREAAEESAEINAERVEIRSQQADLMIEQLEREETAIAARKAAELDLANSVLSAGESIASAVQASYERRLESGEHFSEQEKRSILNAWAAAQAFQVAQATLAAVTTGANTVAQLTAAFVPFPIALGLGAAAAAAMMAGSVAEISSAPPPEFPMGRSPDHTRTVAVRPDEAILTPAATRRVGGPEAVRKLNNGQGLDGAVVELGPETIRALTRARGNMIASGSRSVGRRPLHGR
jgi:hypothetical protein